MAANRINKYKTFYAVKRRHQLSQPLRLGVLSSTGFHNWIGFPARSEKGEGGRPPPKSAHVTVSTCTDIGMARLRTPQYLVDCCTPVTDVVGRQRLKSATQQLMVVPRHRLSTVGRRAFAVHGPMVWNSLPDDLRAQQDYESFRQGLKTWLFFR